jgi:hypothetical protein
LVFSLLNVVVDLFNVIADVLVAEVVVLGLQEAINLLFLSQLLMESFSIMP